MKQIHRSSPELTDEGIASALSLAAEETWDNRSHDEVVYVEKQFELYRSIQPTSTLPKYYIKSWFPYAADTLFNTLLDFKYRKEWDASVKQAYIIEHFDTENDDMDVVYWCTKMPWPFSNRDYVYYRRIVLVKDTFVILSQAGMHKDAPAFSQTQRVEIFASEVAIRVAGVNSCELFMTYTDESNYSVPNAMINWALSSSLPSYLNDLRAACSNYSMYLRGLNDDGLQRIPSQQIRTRIERRNILKRAISLRGSLSTPPPPRNRYQLHRSKSTSEATPPLDYDIIIEFKQQSTGLVLEPSMNHAVVGRCTKPSEASKAKLTPGLIVVSIDGQSVRDCSFVEVQERMERAPRPFLVGFKRSIEITALTAPVAPVVGSSTVLVSYEDALHDFITPCDVAKNTGAKLVAERFGWPVGTILVQVDEMNVNDLPFTEIIHHLRNNTNKKQIVFSAVLTPTQLTKKSISLSKKLSRAFKSSILSPKSSSSSTQTKEFDIAGVNNTTNMDDVLDDYSHIQIAEDNFEWAWSHVQYLVDEERLFSAAELLYKVEEFLKSPSPTASKTLHSKKAIVEAAIVAKQAVLTLVKQRNEKGMAALHEFNHDADAGWRFAQTYFGVSTHWKPGDNGTVWLKLDGISEGVDVFNSLSVIRETDLFHLWAPCCNKAELLANLARVEIITYVNLAIPLMQRDAVIHAFGINAVYEHRCILLLGQSAQEDEHPDIKFPPVKGWNADRMNIKGFRALIEPYSRNRARTCIVVNVDPKCPVPRSLLNFTIKKMAGILLYLLMREAQKVERSGDDESIPYISRILHDPFYAWLRPRMEKWFEKLEAGTLPPPQSVRSPLHSIASTLYGQRVDTKESPSRKRPSRSFMTRPLLDYLYVLPLWPYVLLFVVYTLCITPDTSWAFSCFWKGLLSCVWAWFGVGGLVTWQVRHQVPVAAEFQRLRWRMVGYAICFELVSSICVYFWTGYLMCYMNPHQCQPTVLPSSTHFWLLANSFLVATLLVAIQLVVKLHI